MIATATDLTERRILLIQPPFYRLFNDGFSLPRYPLTLAYLAGAVHQRTHWKAAIYSADFHAGGRHPEEVAYLTGEGYENYVRNLRERNGPVWDEIRAEIARFRPHVVGLTATSQTFTSARHIARLAKELNPHVLTIVGGPHASIAKERILAHPEIDVVVRGEGEQTLVETLQAFEANTPLTNVPGTIVRRDAEISMQLTRPMLQDLDSLPFPHDVARASLLRYAEYPQQAFRYLFASRGCPFNCLFCGSRETWGRKTRVRSPANVVAEMRDLQNRGLKRLHFEDDLFGASKHGIHQLCSAMIAAGLHVQWSCELHAKLVDHDTLSHMRAAGCYSILMGVESGSNEILAKMRKSLTIEEALAACRVIRANGVELTTFFLVGFPDETEATLAATAQAMRDTQADEIVYSIFTPYPFTEAWELCRQRGLIGDDYDMSLFHHQSPANCFTENIPAARFRELASEIERFVDAWNRQRKQGRKLRRFWNASRWLPRWWSNRKSWSGKHDEVVSVA